MTIVLKCAHVPEFIEELSFGPLVARIWFCWL